MHNCVKSVNILSECAARDIDILRLNYVFLLWMFVYFGDVYYQDTTKDAFISGYYAVQQIVLYL